MTETIDGTVEEAIRELFVRRVPMSAKVSLSPDAPTNDVPVWARSPEERLPFFRHWMATKEPVHNVVLDDSREAIYGEDGCG